MMGFSSFQPILTVCILLLVVAACDCNKNDEYESEPNLESRVTIKIFDSDYSTGVTNTYSIENNELVVGTATGVVNDSMHVVFQKTLNESELANLYTFMEQFPLEELEELYADENIDDGDQMIFVIEIGSTKKQIQISNRFQEDIGKLVTLMNGYLEDEFKIKYSEYY